MGRRETAGWDKGRACGQGKLWRGLNCSGAEKGVSCLSGVWRHDAHGELQADIPNTRCVRQRGVRGCS